MATQPFTTPSDNPSNFSFSAAASYLRPNIAVPDSFAVAAASVNEQADTDFEDRLPAGATVASLPDAADGH